MTPAERAAARARCEASTPGPWEWLTDSDLRRVDERGKYTSEQVLYTDPQGGFLLDSDDRDFIAHARVDLPAALDALDAAEEEVQRLRDALDYFADLESSSYDEMADLGRRARKALAGGGK